MTDLAATQRRLWRLLTAPDGVRAALAGEGDPEAASLRGFVRNDPPLASALRLEVYANAYFHRVKDALADDYGSLAALLGREGFNDLVTAYLLVHPSSHPSLRYAGERLPDFLAGDPAAAPFRGRWPCAPDLARLEWALVDAFDAEDAPPLTRRALSARAAATWADLPLALVPGVGLLRVDSAVHDLRKAWERDPEAAVAPPSPGSARLLVWRKDERVWIREPGAEEADCLELLGGGIRFGALCDHLAERCGADEAPGRAAGLLAGWTDAGLLRAESAPSRMLG